MNSTLQHMPWLEQVAESVLKSQHHPSWLVDGDAGIGKSVLAKHLGMVVLCEHQSGCGRCRSCKQYLAGSHPDAHFVLGASDFEAAQPWLKGVCERYMPEESSRNEGAIVIQQIRLLLERLEKTATLGKRKFVVLLNCDTIAERTRNLLLKLIEEPALGTHFLLTARHAASVAVTLRSRCLVFHCHPSAQQLQKWCEHLGMTPKRLSELQSLGVSAPLSLQAISEQYPLYMTLAQNIREMLEKRRPISELFKGCESLSARSAFTALLQSSLYALRAQMGMQTEGAWQRLLSAYSMEQILALQTKILQYFQVMHRISSAEGQKLFADAIHLLRTGVRQHGLTANT